MKIEFMDMVKKGTANGYNALNDLYLTPFVKNPLAFFIVLFMKFALCIFASSTSNGDATSTINY